MQAAASTQDALPGLALPMVTVPPDQPARFAVWGLLDEDAHVYVQQGRVHLQVLVAQHLQRHPQARHVLATYVYPDTGTPAATELAAHSRARAMRCRTEVVISGQALVPGVHAGRPINVLHDVVAIRLADEAIAHHHTGA